MRRVLLMVCIALALAVVPPGTATATVTAKPHVTIGAKITSFSETRDGVTANGILTGRLRSGDDVSKDTSAIGFRVSQRRTSRRCDILTLNLQQMHLQLLGARVDTSAINLELYAAGA